MSDETTTSAEVPARSRPRRRAFSGAEWVLVLTVLAIMVITLLVSAFAIT